MPDKKQDTTDTTNKKPTVWKKHDTAEVIKLWIEAKKENRMLTQRKFFKQIGVHPATGRGRFGNILSTTWNQIEKDTIKKVQKEGVIDINNSLKNAHKAAVGLVNIGAKAVFPIDGKDPKLTPEDFRDGVQSVNYGIRNMTAIANFLKDEDTCPRSSIELYVMRLMDIMKDEVKDSGTKQRILRRMGETSI